MPVKISLRRLQMSKKFTKEQQDFVIKSLENPKYQWRTISGISKETGLSQDIIIEVISQNGDLVVKSSVPSKDGQELYTTRSHFRTSTPVLKKMIGAIKNRLD